MNSSRPAFTKAELAQAKLWALQNLGIGESILEPESVEEVQPESEPLPILTVEEIEAMQRQAYDEAFAQGKAEGYQQGFDQGFAEGSRQGYDENQHLLQEKASQLEKLLTALGEPFKALDAEVEEELVKLAMGMASQIIRRELKLEPGQVIATVREAIKVLPLTTQKMTLTLHPEDAELVRSALSLDEMSQTWAIVEDPLITRGGCQVDSDVSHVDATVENRLAAVIATVLGGEREQDKSR